MFQALPPEARSAIEAEHEELSLVPGEALNSEPALHFVGMGLLLRQAPRSTVCVGVAGPGSCLGWEQAITAQPSALLALEPCRLWRTPLEPVIHAVGRAWAVELVARQAAVRLRELEIDAACNASHMLLQRLAKWLIRLHRASGTSTLLMTQAMLAEMLGVQRTSVNAAALQLQAAGAVRFRRGRVEILSPRVLASLACACA